MSRGELLAALTGMTDGEPNDEATLRQLQDSKIIREFKIPLPNRAYTVYTTPTTPLDVVLMGIHPFIHLSHASAMALHNLTERPPACIYANIEQQAGSPRDATLTQPGIDSAFKRPCRISKNIAKLEAGKVCLLAGKNTGYLGVEELETDSGHKIRTTNLARTIVDIVNRPVYAGGVEAVLNAFRRAKGRLIAEELALTLEGVGHVYPYHQCIGYFLETSGYSEREVNLFRRYPQNYDFYLTHQIADARYIPDWRLFVPKSVS